MKLSALVKNLITNFPTLFVGETLENSKVLVYSHLFNTIGTGYEWANTKKKESGGYLYNCIDEYVKVFNKPYSSFTEDFLTEEEFQNIKKNFEIQEKIKQEEQEELSVELSQEEEDEINEFIAEWCGKLTEEDFQSNKPLITRKESKSFFTPYPFFSYDYSNQYIQEDYKKALIFYWEKVKEYFSNEDFYCSYCYYPSEGNVKSYMENYKRQEYLKKQIDIIESCGFDYTDFWKSYEYFKKSWELEQLTNILNQIEKMLKSLED